MKTKQEELMVKKEKLAAITKKIDQLKNQEKAIIRRDIHKERNARTQRLIIKGGIVEKYLGMIPDSELEKWLAQLAQILSDTKKSSTK